MLEYELNGKIYTEDDLIKAAGGKDKLSAYIKDKGFKQSAKKTKQPTKLNEKFGEDVYKKTFGFDNPAIDKFSEINKTKKKPAVKKWTGVITPEDLAGEESTVAENIGKKLSVYGLTPEETTFGLNRITVRDANKNALAKKIDMAGNELDVDLPEVPTGSNLSRKELESSANQLNEYIKAHGNKNYIEQTKKENPNLVAKFNSSVSPPSRTFEEKLKLYNGELDSEFKNKETVAKNKLGIKGGYAPNKDINLTENDFDAPEKYTAYKDWKKNGQIPLPSEQKLEKFIGGYNDSYRQTKASEFMSDIAPEQRVAINALATQKEDEAIKTTEYLKVKGTELDKRSKDFSLNMAKFEKTPPTPLEIDNIKKEYFALQNETAEYNKKTLATKKDFNNIKAVYNTALKDYNRLNQTGSLLKQTGLGIAGGVGDILATGVAATAALTSPATYKGAKSMLKETLLDPIYVEQKAATGELQSYQQDLQIKDIKNVKDLGRWGASVLTQMPSSMAMAVTGEAALPLFFLSGYGSKQYDIASSQDAALNRLKYNADQIDKGLVSAEDMSDIQKQIASDKKTLNLSEGAKLTSQLLAGTAEVLFEKYGTLGIIKETDNILRSIPPQEIKRQLKVIGKEMGKSAGVEAWTEGLTQVANNFGDIYLLGQDKNYFDGVGDAMAGGAFMGPGFAAMGGAGTVNNNITKAVVSEIASKEEFKARNRKLDEIKKLTGLTDITGLTKKDLDGIIMQPPVRKAVEELVDQMEGEDLRILDKLGKDLSMEDAKKVGDFNQKLRKITKDWNEASKTGGIDEAQLKSLKDYYQKQYNETFKARESLLTDEQLAGKNKKENAQKRINFEATEGYGRYDERLTKKFYQERLANFINLSSDEKQKYNREASSQLSIENPNIKLTDNQINSRASFLYAGKEMSDKLDRDVKASREFAKEAGFNTKIEVIENEAELKQKFPKLSEETLTGFIGTEETDSSEAVEGTSNGIYDDSTDTIIIYRPNAIKSGHSSTGSHEMLHALLFRSFKNASVGSDANASGLKLLNYLKTAQPALHAIVEQRLEEYNPETYAAYGEEVFNALSDTFKDGKVPNDDVLTQISKTINKITKGKYGIAEKSAADILNINSADGKAVYDLIKGYHSKTIKQKDKKNGSLRIIGTYDDENELPISAPKISQNKQSKARVIEVQKKIDNLEDQFDNDEIEYDDYTGRLKAFEEELAKAKAAPEELEKKPEVKKIVTEEDEVKEIIKGERGSIASDKVQKIYEEEGEKGADKIIKLFKPITAKIVAKRRDAPGFNEADLTSEIENGAGGLFDLIRSYDASKGVPLAAYINKNLPLRAITSSRRILEGEFKKDVAEEKGIMAEETASETKEKSKYKNALESNVFSPEVLKTATNKIITIVRTLKSRIDAPVTLNRTVTPLISEIRDEVGRQLDIDIKTMLGGKKDGVFRKELLKNKKYILENMTTTWLMGKDGQGGIPQAIQKQIDGKFVSFPDWVGQKIDREKTTTDQAGRTSGAELVRRLPNAFNNISNEVFLSQFIGHDGNPIRGRKESVSKAMAEEGAFDIINADFAEEGPIFEAFATNQERLGYEIATNTIVDFARQAERGNIKASVATKIIGEAMMGVHPDDRNKIIRRADINDPEGWVDFEKIKVVKEIFNGLVKQEIAKATIYATIKRAAKKEVKDNKQFKINTVERIKSIIPIGEIKLNNGITINITEKDKNGLSFDYLFKKYVLNTEKADAYLKEAKEFIKFLPNIPNSKVFLMSLAGMGYVTTGNNNNNEKYTMPDGSLLSKEYAEAWEKMESNLGKNNTRFKEVKGDVGADDRIVQINSVQTQVNKINNSSISREQKINELQKWLKNKNYIKNKQIILDFYNSLFLAEQDFLYVAKNKEDYLNRLTFLGTKARLNTYLISGARQLANLTHIEITSVKKRGGFQANIEHVREPAIKNSIRLLSGVVNKSEIAPSINETMSISKKNRLALDAVTGTLSDLGIFKMLTLPGNLAKNLINIDELSKGNIVTLEDQIKNISFDVPVIIKNNNNITAIQNSDKLSKAKGISVFDFDDTTGITKGSVLYTMPDGTKGKLNAEEFAKEAGSLSAEGVEFDFSEFSKVVGGKPGPMVEKMKKMIGKFGPENFFILTARPAEAAGPIHEFLSSIGIDIPLENITGLGNGAAQAKADWMVAKAAEGYNDFYFADDAIQNVKAVQDALNVLDVKSKIQQARLKFSKSMSIRFNEIIEENKGVESYKVFSDITARRRGVNKNKFDFYVPPSAADFELLLYKFMGKDTLGEEHKQFFEDALIKPYINGVDMMDAVRQSIKKEYKSLLKSFPEVRKDLEKLTPNKDFTYDQAMRVAIWSQYGTEIPGLSSRDTIYLTDLINNDPDLAAFKDGLVVMGRQKDGWLPPSTYWDADTIVSDLYNITEGSGRKKFLGEFIENTENIFGKWEEGRLVGPNMNKVEAVYGTNVREALEDSIYRMTNGKNRSYGGDKETAAWSSWINGSTGSIMFLNTRSAALQLLGAINFLNFRDNNPIAAAKAFANQPQYWKDFSRIWNSDKLKERRGGLREDVASAEIANAAANSKNKAVAVTSYLLKIGYTPTQLADSFAIAAGGAPFYRNRIKSYLKEGLSETEAESKAWEEFSKVSDETQQSGDPKDISKQQASGAGRLLLVFQNFTMQQSRIVKKAALDLANRRGDTKTNISKIVYYLAVQNILFSTLQQGLFATMFDDDDDDKDKKKKPKKNEAMEIANGVLDSILRGTGFIGGTVATLKNVIVKYFEEEAKKQKADYAKVVLEVANMSPPIGSKLKKTYTALQQTKYEKDLIKERGWGVMQDGRVHLGPMYSVTGKLVEAGTNFPMDRLVNKVENVSQAFNSENTAIQRIATAAGYSPYSVGIEGTKGDLLIKKEAKETRKKEGVIKAKETRRENAERLKDSISKLSLPEKMNYRHKVALEKREKRKEKALEKREERRKKLEMFKKLNANK